MPSPIVSVVMPMRNAAQFLDEAIASIRGQTLAGLEFIIVDDGSTDASAAIAARHAAQDDRIRILTLPPSGIAAACNHGLTAARCDYVARMDADDIAEPDRLARQVAVLAAHPSVAVLGTACTCIDAAGTVVREAGVPASSEVIHEHLLQQNCLIHPTTMLRREPVLAAGAYRPAFTRCEDYDLWLRLSERHRLMNLPDALLRYRLHENQVSRDSQDERALAVLAAQYAARERRAGRGDPTEGLTRLDRGTLRRIGIDEASIRLALHEPPPRRRRLMQRIVRPIAQALLRPMAERDALGPGMWYQRAQQRAGWGSGRIFVIIPSYRDRECQWTIRDLFAKARHPDRISVGVAWQLDAAADADCFQVETRPEQVRSIRFGHRKTRGCSWARQQCLRLWRGEEYALQIDSHMRFVPDWDVRMLEQLRRCPSPRALLTARPLHYDPPDRLGEDAFAGIGAGDFDEAGILHVGGWLAPIADAPREPVPAAFAAGGFIFGPAQRLVDVPYDPHVYFIGEEINLSVRLWTAGWDLFVPNQVLIYHHYAPTGGRKVPWLDDPESHRLHDVSVQRLRHLFGMQPSTDRRALYDLDRYGLGTARTLAQYEAFAGVRFRDRRVEDWARRGMVAQNSHHPAAVGS